MNVSPASRCSVYLRRFVSTPNGRVEIGWATGFFYERDDGSRWLVTNWHVVTARRPDAPEMLSGNVGQSPHWLEFTVVDAALSRSRVIEVELYRNGVPAWIDFDLDAGVDLAAVRLDDVEGWDELPMTSGFAPNSSKRLEPGIDLTIVGYPFARRAERTPFPIWKRAMLASEAGFGAIGHPYLLLDAAALPGMSGSPIYRLSRDYADGPEQIAAEEAVARGEMDPLDASVLAFTDMDRREVVALELVAIYAGATGIKELKEMQLGRAFSTSLLDRLLEHGSAGTNPYPPQLFD